ncbi:small GTP-binding [Chlorella sorokiniana]|uniref:Small GTP-binding n=1 Tax=Chlorella sorokiniana TaxID=3076 RepID=A0A2P6TEE1_CHLSO|nr:small GTP-binding [Chlorella sorokiniana]|eukprot:PRW21009.1 small GTP-binding [Chlorella sorokiniana]
MLASLASGQLQQLNVEGRLHSTERLAATRSLRHLTLRDADGRELLISPGIGSLTALRSLALGGYPLLLPVGARLPASITWLSLGGDYATEVPAQVNQLTQLARLSLSYPVYPPASLPQLPHLSSGLTRLDVTYGRLVPAASTLTRLRHLHAAECMLGGDDAETIDTVLRSLTQLTCLVLMGAGLDTPAALSSLPQLQRCYLQHTDQRAAGGERAQPLPPGSWLRSLRWLGASIDVLAASMAALQAAASALEFIEVGDAESLQPVGWLAPGPTAVIEWLSRHPPLQKASFLANADRLGPSPAFDSRGFAARFAQLCRRRPGLRQAATIGDLPEALLVRCLSFLSFKERQQAALVSRRFAAATCSPELLRKSLELDGTLCLAAGVLLPPSITRVLLANDGTEELPEQLVRLPQLQRLQLARLSALVRLQHLGCTSTGEAAREAVVAALQRMPDLTCLALNGSAGSDLLPAAMSGLSQLRLCCIWDTPTDDNAAVLPLPAGPWLQRLEWLATSAEKLLYSTSVLEHAAALECVSVLGRPKAAIDWHSQAASAFFDWLAQHPPLRCMSLEAWSDAFGKAQFLVHVLQLCRERPELIVQAVEAPPLAIRVTDLPDAVLAHALGFLDFAERLKVALVCRRFAAAASSPELVRHVQVENEHSIPALNSLAAWLAWHGPHVRSLQLTFSSATFYRAGGGNADGLAWATATCLALAGASGQLQQLTFEALRSVHTGWLCTMRSLRRLRLQGNTVHLSPAVAGLTALQSLELAGSVRLAVGARLPGSITRLLLERCYGSDDESSQLIAHLPRLQRLQLENCGLSPPSCLAPLSGSLTRLDAVGVNGMLGDLPELGALTRLQHLYCWFVDHTACATVCRALPHLTALTCLVLEADEPQQPAPAVELAGLSCLQLCHLSAKLQSEEGGPLELPGGPWLRKLRWLSAGAGTLLGGTAVRQLQAAAQLERVIANDRRIVYIADLPDEVLQHALGFLDLRERQQVALVCRRFAAAACAPQLLRNVELPRIRSLGTLLCLGTWLTRHGAHVRQLEFDAIAGLSSLQSLELHGMVELADEAALPTSVTRLLVEDDEEDDMPQQFARLPQLQRLKLDCCSYSPDSQSKLSALGGSLTRLQVHDMEPPGQDCLATLTRLQHLECDMVVPEAHEAVAAALPHLTGLTCLALWGTCGLDPLLPALAGLRASQGGNSPSATLNIDDLPEAVLVRCLGFLEMVERQRAALACRRFAAAARAPQLLREVNVHIGSDLPKLHSLTAWLTRHGSHVRRLTGYVASDDDPDWNAAAASCLAAVGTAGQLDELNLEGILDSTEWLAAMRSLQRCRLVNDENGELRVSAALGGLTALESLDLQGEPIKLLPARLPASITYLHLCDSSDNMPQQVAKLPRLARLKLRLCSYSADSLDQLSRLSSSLTRL